MAGNNNKNKHQKPKYTKPSNTDASKRPVSGKRQESPIPQARTIDVSRIVVANPVADKPVVLSEFKALELKGGADKARTNTPMTRTENLKNTAPYNFVRLNTQVVLPPVGNYIGDKSDDEEQIKAYKEYISSKGKYAKHTGYFDITIENLTPLHIGDGKEFFNDGKNKCIPGSSIRGAVKNLFSIITNSGFKAGEDFADKNLYYRTVAVANNLSHLQKLYAKTMTDKESRNINVKAGYLVRDKEEFKIIPSINGTAENISYQSRMRNHPNEPLLIEKYMVYIDPNLPKNFDALGKGGFLWHHDYVDAFSGDMDTKKRFYRISRPDLDKEPLKISQDVLKDYWSDNSKGRFELCSIEGKNGLVEKDNLQKGYAQSGLAERFVYQDLSKCYIELKTDKQPKPKKKNLKVADHNNENWDIICKALRDIVFDSFAPDREPLTEPSRLLIGLEEYDYVIPCFYQDDGKYVTSFGANPYYRIPYNHKISDHVNEQLQTDLVDFTKAIFGSKEHWGSRVFFENCYLDSSSKVTMDNHESITLRTPNPTSFQNYLEQHDAKVEHWDTEATQIRGYKLYWHRNMDWKADTNLQGNNKTMLNPIVSKVKFKGRIKFESLDDVELGALVKLFALLKKSNMAMKLGMGKSIGLGSVKINADLYEEGKNYYTTLFDDNGFLGYELSQSKDKYESAFISYMNAALAEQGAGAQENYTLRMRELEKILSVEKIQDKEFIDRTNYLPFGDKGCEIYVKKVVLPDIETVFKG